MIHYCMIIFSTEIKVLMVHFVLYTPPILILVVHLHQLHHQDRRQYLGVT